MLKKVLRHVATAKPFPHRTLPSQHSFRPLDHLFHVEITNNNQVIANTSQEHVKAEIKKEEKKENHEVVGEGKMINSKQLNVQHNNNIKERLGPRYKKCW